MIYLRTGANGTGKTSGLLGELYDQINKGRKLYVHGIKDLAITHTALVCDNPICDVCPDLKKENPNHLRLDVWYEVCDKDSLIVVDEAQLHYNLAYKKQAALDSFDIHRHNNQDVYFVCPHPMKLAIGLRRLVANHQHIFYDFLGRHKYTWYECSQNLAKSGAESKRYKLDKRAFSLYTSASGHSQLERKIPFLVFVLIVAIVTAIYFGYSIYSKYNNIAKSPVPAPASVSAPVLASAQSVPAPVLASAQSVPVPASVVPAPVTTPVAPVIQQGVHVGNKVSNLLVPELLPSYKCLGFVSKVGVTYRFCRAANGQIVYVVI